MCVGKVTGFSPSTSVSLCRYHSPYTTYSSAFSLEKEVDEAWTTSNKEMFFRISGSIGQKSTSTILMVC
jgi:hypothetical protein